VLKAGIAKPEEIPDDCGVMFADKVSFQIARAVPVKSAEWSTALDRRSKADHDAPSGS
jgi:hypothetical protein